MSAVERSLDTILELDGYRRSILYCLYGTDGRYGSATWYTTHVNSTVLTTVLSDPLLL
jgi:hypothetical protein